jgi:hypothetical protein
VAWCVVITGHMSPISWVLTCFPYCSGPEYEWRGPYPDGDDAIPLAKLRL